MKIYENIFTRDECNQIINLVKENYELQDFLIYDSIKKMKTIQPEYSQRKGLNFFDKKLEFVEDRFLKLSNDAFSDINHDKITVYRFNQYSQNEYINYHGDFDAISHGAITTVGLFLNDDYEGGEFWYIEDEKEYMVQQKMGSVIVFQSDTLHKITQIKKGVRYSLNSWPRYTKPKNRLI